MDNHDVISMSESTTSTSKKTKDSSDLAMTKKKLKVLKQALKEEKELSDKKDKQLSEVKSQIVQFQQQIEEKDKKYAQLLQDKRNIEDSLLRDGGLKKKDDGSDLKRSISNQEPKLLSFKVSEKAVEKVPEKVEKISEDHSEELTQLKETIEALKKQIEQKDDSLYVSQQTMKDLEEKSLQDNLYFEQQNGELKK